MDGSAIPLAHEVNDGWTDIIGKLAVQLRKPDASLDPDDVSRTMELADFDKMEQIRGRVDELVDDPATAAALKPWYRQFCKRPCFHDEYLQTFNRPNVTLVDTQGRGVDRVTERGVVVGETEFELDCLIYATGFEFGTDFSRRTGCELVGRGGQTLTDKWADGPRTLHGMHTRGFPNCFIMSIIQSGVTPNFPHHIEKQAAHVAYIIDHAIRNDIGVVEASQQAEDEWVSTIIELAQNNRAFFEACTPGYYNNEGKLSDRAAQNGFYGGGAVAFFELMAAWRAEGSLAGLEFSRTGGLETRSPRPA